MEREKISGAEASDVTIFEEFEQLDDSGVAHGTLFDRMFEDTEHRVMLEKRIRDMQKGPDRDYAFFRLTKRYYLVDRTVDSISATVKEIESADERVRCLVQIAGEILKEEGNVEKADSVISLIADEDKQGYLKYYQKEKKVLEK